MQVQSSCTLDSQRPYVNFMKWMKLNGYKRSKKLRPCIFEDTGRGIKTEEKIEVNDCIVSIPSNLLITSSAVLKSDLGDYIKRWKSKHLSPQQVLSVFLVHENRKKSKSFWAPYLELLPEQYDVPAYWTTWPKNLPFDLETLVKENRQKVKNAYKDVLPFLYMLNQHTQQPIISFKEFLWGWCTVDTRSVYFLQAPNSLHTQQIDHYALAPFLDFFNHSPNAKVKAGFNHATQTYDIKSLLSYEKHDQVFINYGSHDNVTLLLNYGFIVPRNPQSFVDFSTDDIIDAIISSYKDTSSKEPQLKLLGQHNLLRSLYIGFFGISWSFRKVVEVLLLPSKESNHWFMYIENQHPMNDKKVNVIIEQCVEKRLSLLAFEEKYENLLTSLKLPDQMLGSILKERTEILKCALNCIYK